MARPRLALITVNPGPWAMARIANAVARGASELDVPMDVVYLRGFDGEAAEGSVRTIGLDVPHLRGTVGPIARYLRDARPQAAFVVGLWIAPAALLAGRLSGQPVIPWETSFIGIDARQMRLRMKALPALHRVTYRWAPAVAVPSNDVGKYLLARHRRLRPEEVHHLPHPLDIDSVSHANGGLAPERDHEVQLCANSRLAKQKGIDVLLEALHLRRHALPDWSLVVVGDGECRERLERMTLELELDARVTFAGLRDNPYPFVRGADIFVHPARWDPGPVVLAEALYLGVPIVATSCPGSPREVLGEGEFGWLVPPEDPEALGDALVRLSNDEETRSRLARSGPARARQYHPTKVVEKMLDIAGGVGS
jgi:glycosyltransferase involved in cell wall biosynthesis